MKYAIALFALLICSPAVAQEYPVDIDVAHGVAFVGGGGDDSTVTASHLSVGYNFGYKLTAGLGFKYDALDLDALERAFIFGRYVIRGTNTSDTRLYLALKIGYTNSAEPGKLEFNAEPTIGIEQAIEGVYVFAEAALDANSTSFWQMADPEILDARVSAGVRFRPEVRP